MREVYKGVLRSRLLLGATKTYLHGGISGELGSYGIYLLTPPPPWLRGSPRGVKLLLLQNFLLSKLPKHWRRPPGNASESGTSEARSCQHEWELSTLLQGNVEVG